MSVGPDHGLPESVGFFVERAKALSIRLRTDPAKPCTGQPVRVHDGSSPINVVTDRHHHNGSSTVKLHRHLPWESELQIDVYGNGNSPDASSLGTDTIAGTADLLDAIVAMVENRTDRAHDQDLLQTSANVCGALIGPSPWPIVLHAPTRWSPLRLVRADGTELDVPEEATGLIGTVPEMTEPVFWVQEGRDDVPRHPRASLNGWSVASEPTDAMTVARVLLMHQRKTSDRGKAA